MKTEKQNEVSTFADENQLRVDEGEIFNPLKCETSSDNKTEKLREELKTEREQYLRLAAEYDNYRRRTRKERKEFADEGKRLLLEQLITIEDDLELALKNIGENTDQVAEALKLIERRFQNLLLNNGVEPFDSQGETFDPEIHEAFDVIAATEKHKSETVHSEVRRGYFWNGTLLRPAIVIVAQ
jgi:molecular chaperone GrpE